MIIDTSSLVRDNQESTECHWNTTIVLSWLPMFYCHQWIIKPSIMRQSWCPNDLCSHRKKPIDAEHSPKIQYPIPVHIWSEESLFCHSVKFDSIHFVLFEKHPFTCYTWLNCCHLEVNNTPWIPKEMILQILPPNANLLNPTHRGQPLCSRLLVCYWMDVSWIDPASPPISKPFVNVRFAL